MVSFTWRLRSKWVPFSGFRYIKWYGLSRVKVYEKEKKICHRPTLYVIPNYSSFILFQRFGKGTQSVRDKSNLNIGYENYPKSVTFLFERDLSAGHATSFSMWLACWSGLVLIGESYCIVLWQGEHRTCEYLVRFFSSMWLSTNMFCIFILVFTFEYKKICTSPQHRWTKFYWNCMFSSVIDGWFEEIGLWLRQWS